VLPDSRAGVGRAPNLQRLASLLSSAQADVAVLRMDNALALYRGQPPFADFAPMPLRVLVETQGYQLVCREDFKERHAYLVAEVRPQVTGIVKERLFTEGSLVSAGQPLFQLDDATYRADLNSALASLRRAEAAAEVARLNAARLEELVKTHVVSTQDYDNAAGALHQAEAEVGVAQALVAKARLELDFARISSPIAGRIGKSAVTQGALVTEDQAQPLATVQQLDPVYVDLTQSSSELLGLRKALANGGVRDAASAAVKILLEDGTPYEHAGELTFADVSVDPSTGSFALRVIVPNPDSVLMPGMYVRAVISMGVRQSGVLVPQQALPTRRGAGEALVGGR
jgi:membrane fusion protein (multidrug efflux system)